MSDSLKPALLWYWGGGGSFRRVSSPAPALTPREEDIAAATRREENDAAELVLEQLDEQWFCDNVVRWPSSRPGSPPGVIDKDIASPFRRVPLPGFPSASQGEVATKPRPWATLHPPRSRQQETRRLSDGDHHLRRYQERDAIPRRRLLIDTPEDSPRRRGLPDLAPSAANLPQTPPNLDDQSRFISEATSMDDVFSPLALPPSGPLVGVTEDEELENDLFAKMLANRPAKLMTINPGRFARGPLQDSNSSGGEPKKSSKLLSRQRRRLKGTKSLTDLEYEELRGLKDLGFEVSKDDLTPHVVRMFPGLQRQGIPPYNSPNSQREQMGLNVLSQSRFPSVQHLVHWPRRPDSPLPNAPFQDRSVDMKGQLKSWASEMASIVSTEC